MPWFTCVLPMASMELCALVYIQVINTCRDHQSKLSIRTPKTVYHSLISRPHAWHTGSTQYVCDVEDDRRKAFDGFLCWNSVQCFIQSQPEGHTGNLDLHIPRDKERQPCITEACRNPSGDNPPFPIVHSELSHSFISGHAMQLARS